MNVPASNKFLYFAVDGDNAAMFPASQFRGGYLDADDSLVLQFRDFDSLTNGAPDAHVEITVADETHKAVLESIANEIAFGNSAFVVVADDDADVLLTSNISSCDAIDIDLDASA